MRSPYVSEAIENCLTCNLREGRLFCDLTEESLQALDAIGFSSVYPRGAMLFAEGQTARGVFVLCSGRVKLMSSSSNGKTLMRVVGPGEVIGLSATVSGKPYEVTAEVLEPCQINFIRSGDFLRFLQLHGEVCLRVAQHLSNDYQTVSGQLRSLNLSGSAAEKLARLLLDWCDEGGMETDQGTRFKLGLTHEEMSQMIGSSRETVTRLLAEFRQNQTILLKGSTLVVCDKSALRALVGPE